jgi:hypothetical protein
MDKIDIPISLTSFLRPTVQNYNHFVMDFDKIISENIDLDFFKDVISIEKEILRNDGRVVVERKGSLKLLEEWLEKIITWNDPKEFRKRIIGPLRDVRKQRSKPAHNFTKNHYSVEFYDKRKKLMCSVFNSLSNIREALARHPLASNVERPKWLADEKIDVF